MNVTERKPNKEILESLVGVRKVFILGCQGCPLGCETGGQPWVDEMKSRTVCQARAMSLGPDPLRVQRAVPT